MKRCALVLALAISLFSPALLWAGEREQPSTGTITGTLLDGTTGAALANRWVYTYNTTGSGSGYIQSNASGQYTLSGLPPGSYVVYVWGYGGYLTQIYPSINCTSCDFTSGTLVPVTAGNTTTNIDFNLVQGGRISGYVFDDYGNPI